MTTSPSSVVAATTTARSTPRTRPRSPTPAAPTVILAKTLKGWTLGPGIAGRNVTHQAKKLNEDELKIFRDRLELPIPDEHLKEAPYYHPGQDAPEIQYMLERRAALGGVVPKRRYVAKPLPAPTDDAFTEFFAGSDRPASTTMAFSRLTRNLVRDPQIGKRVVPIIPDEARTFGMDPLFKEVGIYNPLGQRYTPVDKELLLSYIEKADGQLLEEGITEAGSMSSFQAAGTSYATWSEPMVPFYTFYSMFGLQRTGDQVWAFGDARGRGFLMGATAGRTTLTGEGLQHDDGQSHLLASTIPNVLAYDPAFAYELAIVVREGIDRMYGERGEDVFYYITIYNENWVQPAKADGVEEGVLRGLYRFRAAPSGSRPVQLLASGPTVQQALRAQQILAEKYDVAADVWSATSFQQLRNDALDVERWNRLHPDQEQRVAVRARVHRAVPGTDRRRHRLPEGGARTWSRAGSTGRTPCSGPMASAAPTRGRRCAPTSRSTPSTSPTRRSTGCAWTGPPRRTS